MPGIVSTVYVLILANPRLSCLVHVSIYCHFLLSPVLTLPPLVTVTDQITTLGIIIDKRFIFVCLQSSRSLFSSSCPEALAFLSYRGHGCIQCKCSGSIPPWLLQLTPVLFDCSDSNIANLQHIQNIAAWIVLNTQRLCSSTCTGYLFISVFSIKYLL